MILSDREILAALAREAIRITPFPGPGQFSSTALDLALSPELRRWKELPSGDELRLRPGLLSFNITQILEDYTEKIAIPSEGFALLPGQFVLGWTLEKIQLPYRSRIAARVEGKSSLARLGLGVHVTAPTIHAGFGVNPEDETYEGSELQLEIWNVGKFPIVLDPGIAICQLIFEAVDGTPEKGYQGRFGVQGPQLATESPGT
jgi:dCTP deaminase